MDQRIVRTMIIITASTRLCRKIVHCARNRESADLAGGNNLPLDWKDRFPAMIRLLMAPGFYSYTYPGTTPQGVEIFLIGDFQSSRLLGAHPRENHPGILYLMRDNGKEPELSKARAAKPFCIGQITGNNDYWLVRQRLDLDNYRNNRLVGKGRPFIF